MGSPSAVITSLALLLATASALPQFPQQTLRPFVPRYTGSPYGSSPTPFGSPTPSPFGSPTPSPFGSPTPVPSFVSSPAPPAYVSSPAPPIYRPIGGPIVKEGPGYNYAILKQAQEVNFDGTFNYEYETENGIRSIASGGLKNPGTPDEAQVIQGSYSYTAPDGTPIQVTYYADETGFHAEGAHLPVPPPIPEAIARSLEYLRSLPPTSDDEIKKKKK